MQKLFQNGEECIHQHEANIYAEDEDRLWEKGLVILWESLNIKELGGLTLYSSLVHIYFYQHFYYIRAISGDNELR